MNALVGASLPFLLIVFSQFFGEPVTGNEGIYKIAKKGKFDCAHWDMESEGISDPTECKVAAWKLEIPFRDTKGLAEDLYPKGCYVFENSFEITVYWNTHHVGAAESRSSPICKVEGNNSSKLITKQIVLKTSC